MSLNWAFRCFIPVSLLVLVPFPISVTSVGSSVSPCISSCMYVSLLVSVTLLVSTIVSHPVLHLQIGGWLMPPYPPPFHSRHYYYYSAYITLCILIINGTRNYDGVVVNIQDGWLRSYLMSSEWHKLRIFCSTTFIVHTHDKHVSRLFNKIPIIFINCIEISSEWVECYAYMSDTSIT